MQEVRRSGKRLVLEDCSTSHAFPLILQSSPASGRLRKEQDMEKDKSIISRLRHAPLLLLRKVYNPDVHFQMSGQLEPLSLLQVNRNFGQVLMEVIQSAGLRYYDGDENRDICPVLLPCENFWCRGR